MLPRNYFIQHLKHLIVVPKMNCYVIYIIIYILRTIIVYLREWCKPARSSSGEIAITR